MVRKADDLTEATLARDIAAIGKPGGLVLACGGFPTEARALRILGSPVGVVIDPYALEPDEWELRAA